MNLKRVFLIFVCAALCSWGAYSGSGPVVELNPGRVIDLALHNSRAVRAARLKAREAEISARASESPYKPVFESEVNHSWDDAQQVVPIFGTSRRVTNFNFALLKKWNTGTSTSIKFNNQRESTNSSFATINPSYTSSVSIEVSQSLLNNAFGIKDRLETKAALEAAAGAGANADWEVNRSVRDSLAAYWLVVQAGENVRIAREAEKAAKRLLEVNKKNLKYGLVEEVDLVAFEVHLEEARRNLALARDDLVRAGSLLRTVLSLDSGARIVTEKPALRNVELNLQELKKRALSVRPDIVALRRIAKEKKLRLAYWKNSSLPTLDLVASLRANGIDDDYFKGLGYVGTVDNPTVFLGIKFQNIFGGSVDRVSKAKAEVERERILIELKQAECAAMEDVERLYHSVNVRRKEVDRAIKLSRLQDKKAEGERKRFRQGRSSTNVVIQYENEAVVAKLQVAGAIAAYETALVDLSLASGGLMEDFKAEGK